MPVLKTPNLVSVSRVVKKTWGYVDAGPVMRTCVVVNGCKA